MDVEIIIGTGFQLLLTKDSSKLGGLVQKWRLCPAKNGGFTTRNWGWNLKNMRYVGIYDIFGYLMETYGITWDRYEKIRITSYYLIQKLVEYPQFMALFLFGSRD